MTENSHERKVRGSQIRSSRENKKRRREDKSIERMKRAESDGGSTSTSTANQSRRSTSPGAEGLEDEFIPKTRDFIETDAVNDVRQRMQRWLTVDRPVHLIGPTGCGKTALAMHVARERDQPVVWINGDAELSTSDLVGEYAEKERISERDQYIHNVLKSKEIVKDRWVNNPLTLAVEEGATLVYNEFSRTKPVANNVLLSVFEEGVLELPGQRGESRYVDVHPDFRAILTSNSVEYAGVHEPQDALLDRLIGVYMDFYDLETEVEIVDSQINGDIDIETKQLVELIRKLRDRLEINVGTRAAIMVAEGASTVNTVDKRTLIELSVDVLASKVAQYSEVQTLRTEIETVVEDTDIKL
ncbi:gas vesicle protein GvpN [Haloquadratum walsbyi]|jgi:gas vesicle protein GvpN|uniref:Gas vesicle protein GvpN n=1 Tax=Haloquadratum walsbyi J07HQW2 TaxID=1238425 RepID=U1N1V1_9EURY|nr:gas vesicle protein GvpN [Haloquadratum walsbyi]ERG96839.1 MAG: gas vesicle protein GvpN [Haloquadratum walsbyi J07HQW2]